MSEHRYPSLEGLRFISSLAIVLYHYIPYAERGSSWSGQFRIAVDLFFVISGIVIANGYLGRTGTWSEYRKFMWRRFARLYPLHLATLSFYVMVGAAAAIGVLTVVKQSKYDFGEFWANLLLVHAWGFSSQMSFNTVSWSISAEWFVYLTFPLIAWVVARRAGFAAVAASLAVGIAISHGWIGRGLTQLTWDFSILRALPSFALGVWVYANREFLASAIGPRMAAAGLAASSIALTLVLAMKASDYAVLGAVYSVVTFAFLCDDARVATPFAWAPVSRLGSLTYSIYMLHPLVATTFLSFLAKGLLGPSFWLTYLTIAAAIAMTFVLAILSYRYFEQPMRQTLTSLTSRQRDQSQSVEAVR
jgi:peptidoglycan/LPS O-acetylase OafA/YrhL